MAGALDGRHAVVTGGGRGIGAAVAQTLAAEGARVTLMGRDEARLKDRLETLPIGQAVRCDVTDEAGVAAAFIEAAQAFGPVAILVNNAGAAESAPFARTSLALLRRMLEVNLIGTFLCSRAALPDMLEAGFGRIVNVASIAGLKGAAYVSAYCAAKHGVIGLTRALALETATKGITVNAVCPSYTDTDMTRRRGRQHRGEDRAKRGRCRDGAGQEEPPGPADSAGGSGGDRALAVRARRRGDHRAGDRGRRRRGDVMALARPHGGRSRAASGACGCGCACMPRPA